MTPDISPPPKTSKAMFRAGWVVSVLAIFMLGFSAVFKLAQPDDVFTEFARLGYPEDRVVPIGITELVCTLLYAVPQTSLLGAILLTGYLGGAVATHVRVPGDPFWGPIVGGILVWLGLYLRDGRLRALVPWRRSPGP